MSTVVIEERFNGPPGSANGGYCAGCVAALVDGPAEVTLRSPPPLARPLELRASDGRSFLLDGETVVAEGRPADPGDLHVPEPPSLTEAEAISRAGAGRWAEHHPFPSCFVCGPARGEDDGMRIFPGAYGDDGRHAATWTPHAWMADDDGAVRPEYVWAALDCPSSAPGANFAQGPPIMLGRLTARLEQPAHRGETYVVTSWPVEVDGRKRTAGSAVFTAGGALVAVARAVWIELRPR